MLIWALLSFLANVNGISGGITVSIYLNIGTITYPVVVRDIGPPPKGLRNRWQKHTAAVSRNSWWKPGVGPPGLGIEPTSSWVGGPRPATLFTVAPVGCPIWPVWPGGTVQPGPTEPAAVTLEAVLKAMLYILYIIEDTSYHFTVFFLLFNSSQILPVWHFNFCLLVDI